METPVVFECKGEQIVGMLHLPPGRKSFPVALLLHGFTGNKSEAHRLFVKLARALLEHGIASLRFDFRGAGDSAGRSEDLTIRSEVADALEALKFLSHHKRLSSRRVALIGFSLGGAIAAYVAARAAARVRSVALLAPVAEGAGILDELSTPESVVALAQTGLTDYGGNLVGVAFIRQFAEMRPVRELARARRPTLIIHGENDQTVPVHHANLYERAVQNGKTLVKKVIIPGADHTFNNHVWETRVLAETLHWLDETL